MTNYRNDPADPAKTMLDINAIAIAPDGTVWVAPNDHMVWGLFSYDGRTWTHHTEFELAKSVLFSDIAVTLDGVVWASGKSDNRHLIQGIPLE